MGEWSYHTQASRKRTVTYHGTGLHKDEILDLCEMIYRGTVESERLWLPILGLWSNGRKQTESGCGVSVDS
jgi:hypothetical protein